MRPLDILSITLVLCATALLLALPLTGAGPDLSERAERSLHYPGSFTGAFTGSAETRALFEIPASSGERLTPQKQEGDERAVHIDRRLTELDYRLSQQIFSL